MYFDRHLTNKRPSTVRLKPHLQSANRNECFRSETPLSQGAERPSLVPTQSVGTRGAFFPNSDAFIAALKTIEILERNKVLKNIWEKGERFMRDI